jgi:Tat protein translocase TatC
MTLVEHLGELRTRLIRSVLAIVLGIIVLLATYDHVLNWMRGPYTDLCKSKPKLKCGDLSILGPLEGFTTRLSICTYGGIIVALPVILWQMWQFVVPALHAKEKKYAIPFILSSVLLFGLGGLVAYYSLTPSLDFLISWAGTNVNANFQVSKYVSLFGLMIAAFGVRVPRGPRVPAAGRGAHPADAAQAVALRDPHHLRHRCCHHPQRRPVQHDGHGHPDVRVLRDRGDHRHCRAEAEAGGAGRCGRGRVTRSGPCATTGPS